jgi:hypothetical protein
MSWIPLVVALASGAIGRAERPVTVPVGKPVMVDGHFSAKEWEDAAEIAMPESIRLYFKQSGDFVYVCVRLPKGGSGFTDLYLSTPERPAVNLHASAKLGERVLTDNGWPEWTWWNNVDWVANVSRVDSFEKRSFLPEDVREFQIRRSRFPGGRWLVRFEVSVAVKDDYRAVAFPEGTNSKTKKGWLQLDLGK